MTMKIFALPFFKHFSLSLKRKKTCGDESHEKKTKHMHAAAAHDWCIYGHCKNEARQIIVFVVER